MDKNKVDTLYVNDVVVYEKDGDEFNPFTSIRCKSIVLSKLKQKVILKNYDEIGIKPIRPYSFVGKIISINGVPYDN